MATGAFAYLWIVLPSEHLLPCLLSPLASEMGIYMPERLVHSQRLVVEGLRLKVSGVYTYDVARQTLSVLLATQGGGMRMRTVCVPVWFDRPVGGEVPNVF
jgi:hypothetical protein